jgi:HEAT repeat protein
MKKKLAAAIFFCIFFGLGCTEEGAFISPGTDNSSVDLTRYKKQAIEVVRMGLMDENPLIQNHAIEVAATTNTTQLLPTVLKLMDDQSVPVRFAAAVAMGDTRFRPSEYSLKRLMSDKDENVRIAAYYSLTKLGHKNLEDSILNSLQSSNQTVRANAAMLLGKLGDKRVLDALYSALNDPKSSNIVRIQALESIAKLGDERLYQRIWAMLISKYTDDRIMGIRAMGGLGTRDAKNAITTLLYNNEDNPGDQALDVRLCAAEELGKLGDYTGEKEVLGYFSSLPTNLSALPSSRTNHLAIMAIGRIQSRQLGRYLPKILSNPNKDLKLAAAQSVLLIVD